MTNMTAVAVRMGDRHRCVVEVDGLAGVYILLPADDLERQSA